MQIRTSRRGSLVIRAGITATCLLMAACATTTGGGHGPAPIPEGMGRLIIEAGGIRKLNYYIVDQDTDEEVFADHPRSAGSSPIGFESGSRATNLVQDMPPGLYTVVVLTDIEDFVRVRDVEVVMGEPRYATPQVGRFMLRVLADKQQIVNQWPKKLNRLCVEKLRDCSQMSLALLISRALLTEIKLRPLTR